MMENQLGVAGLYQQMAAAQQPHTPVQQQIPGQVPGVNQMPQVPGFPGLAQVPNTPPQVQQGYTHPHTQLQIPGVQVPPAYNTGFNATPEQMLQQAQNQHFAGQAPPTYQHPQINYTPAGGQMPQMSVAPMAPPQMQMHPGMMLPGQAPQAPQAPQNPQMPQMPQMPQQGEEYGIDPQRFPNVKEEVLQELVDMGEQNQVPHTHLEQFVNSELQNMQRYGSLEEYSDYQGKMGQLTAALRNTHGDEQAANMLANAKEKIMETGGQPMLQKFQTDPAMLDPAVITPFLTGGAAGEQNPYLEYLQGGTSEAPRQAPVPGQMSGGQIPPGGMPPAGNLEQINARINEYYAPANQAKQYTNQWNQEMVELFKQKNYLENSQNMGGMRVA